MKWGALLLSSGLLAVTAAEPKPPFAFDDLIALQRIGEAQLSPDGKTVAYVRRSVSLEKNQSVGQIWLVPSQGGEPRQLTFNDKGASRPRWHPDGTSLAFLSSRSGTQQVWLLSLEGGEARQLTTLSFSVDNHAWSPGGKHLGFTAEIFPETESDSESQAARQREVDARGTNAQIIDGLLYRHWQDWRGGKRTHTFVYSLDYAQLRDLSKGDREAPPFSLGGPDSFAFSPDSRSVVYTRGPAPEREAWSTDANLYLTSISGDAESECITCDNKGWDGSPSWSPDGNYIAFRSQERDGYEADKFRLALYDRRSKKTRYLAPTIDRWVDEILWSGDSQSIYFTVEDEGRSSIYRIAITGDSEPVAVRKAINLSDLSLAPDESFFIGLSQSITHPPEVARFDLKRKDADLQHLTSVNATALALRAMPNVSSVQYPGAKGENIQAWLLKPPGYDASKEHPFLLMIHGGPQSAWRDAFSYRWNLALWAARGYVVLAPNFHGSSGFGQKFTEQISGDWGGACYEDLMRSVDWALEQKLASPNRMGAAGASFGGYMVNWILGHTNRFQALVSHAGVYNLESMYGTTEELWFPEWEFGGPFWKNREAYEKFSPHRFAANFKTPTLVTHGELDFRVNVGEGLQLFTALKRQGVPSRLLYFPDEGHWILKPKNSRLWHETVFAWLDQYLKKE